MSFLDIFRIPPHKDQIEDQKEIRKKFGYWRVRIFLGMFIGYTFFYFTRYSFLASKPFLIEYEGYTLKQLGAIQSSFLIIYGLSKFISGVFADRANPRYVMGIGLIMTGVFNILFGLSGALGFFILFWFMNGFFQGWGWPACGRLIMHWYSKSERGRWWGMWNVAQNLGAMIIPVLAIYIGIRLGWRCAMFVPGTICILGGFFIILTLRDTPQSLGLPPVQEYRNDENDHQAHQQDELTLRERLFKYVLGNGIVWVIALSCFFLFAMKDGLGKWFHIFLMQQKGFSTKVLITGGIALSFFEFGGLFGSIFAGFMSDCMFKGKRWPVILLFLMGVLLSLILLKSFVYSSILISGTLIFLVGFFAYGPQLLFSMAVVEMSHKKAVGSITGFLGLFSYLGAAFAGLPLMVLKEKFGWEFYFSTLIYLSVLSLLFYLPVCVAEIRHGWKRKLAIVNISDVEEEQILAN